MQSINHLDDVEPKLTLYVKIYSQEIGINDVLCEIYTSKKLTTHAKIRCFLTRGQVSALNSANEYEFNLTGNIYNSDGKIYRQVEAKQCYIEKSHDTNSWSTSSVFISIITLHADKLYIMEPVFRSDQKKYIDNITTYYKVTPCYPLTPFSGRIKSFTGEISIDEVRTINFELENNLKLEFFNHYEYFSSHGGGEVTVTNIIAKCEDSLGNDPNDNLIYIDDFLMIVSFLSRQRCVCVGWESWDSLGKTVYYRGNISLPGANIDHTDADALIIRPYIKSSISECYKYFVEETHKELLRTDIYKIIDWQHSSIEKGYLSLFSAIETFVKFFTIKHPKAKGQKDNILEKAEVDLLRCYLDDIIDFHPLFNRDKERQSKIRKSINNKIREINQYSLPTKLNLMCRFYGIDLSGIWPLISNDRKCSLYNIKNKLMHGDTFSRSQYNALSVALEHLQWTAEIIALSIFEYPISHSTVDKDFLARNTYAYGELEKSRDILS